MFHPLIQFITLFLLLLVIGIFWGPWFALHRSIHVFQAEEFIHIVKTMAANLAIPMRIMMPSCLFFLLLTAWTNQTGNIWVTGLNLSAFLLMAIAVLLTMLVEVPIVAQIKEWSAATIPTNWQLFRNRWVKYHVIRTSVSLASFACFTASVLFM